MTDDSAFKRQVRDRMAGTGENYTQARRMVIAEQEQDAAIRDVIQRAVGRVVGVSAVTVERTADQVRVDIRAARPVALTGPRGEEADRLRGEMEDVTGRRVQLNIYEVPPVS